MRWGVLVGPGLVRRRCSRLSGDREDRIGHDVGPVHGDLMAGPVDDDMASLRAGAESSACRRPVRAEPTGEAAGSAQDDDGHIGKGPCGGAQLRQGRSGHGGVIVELVVEDGPHDPPPPLEGKGQAVLHLLVPRIHQDQAGGQVRPAEGRHLDQDAAPAVPCQHAWSCRQPGNHRCQVIDLALDGRQTWRRCAAA